jgi:hypothetical protein
MQGKRYVPVRRASKRTVFGGVLLLAATVLQPVSATSIGSWSFSSAMTVVGVPADAPGGYYIISESDQFSSTSPFMQIYCEAGRYTFRLKLPNLGSLDERTAALRGSDWKLNVSIDNRPGFSLTGALVGLDNVFVESALSGDQVAALAAARGILSIGIEKTEGSVKRVPTSVNFPAKGTGPAMAILSAACNYDPKTGR